MGYAKGVACAMNIALVRREERTANSVGVLHCVSSIVMETLTKAHVENVVGLSYALSIIKGAG